jgi:Domain of unknown function (DUF3883)
VEKLGALSNLGVVAAGQIEHLGTATVETSDAAGHDMHRDDAVEAAATSDVMRFERERGWEPTDVSKLHDGSGFDVRSVSPADSDGKREVRRIEVKRRAGSHVPVELTPNEWLQAGRHRDSFWLYVVWSAIEQPQLLRIQDPVAALRGLVEDLTVVNGYRVPAAAISDAAE